MDSEDGEEHDEHGLDVCLEGLICRFDSVGKIKGREAVLGLHRLSNACPC